MRFIEKAFPRIFMLIALCVSIHGVDAYADKTTENAYEKVIKNLTLSKLDAPPVRVPDRPGEVDLLVNLNVL